MFGDISYGGAALAGLVAFFTPCILPMVPFYLSYMAGISMAQLTGEGDIQPGAQRRLVVSALFFALGVTTIFGLLGLGATAAGQAFAQWKQELSWIAAAVIFVFGLHFLHVIRIPFLMREARMQSKADPSTIVGAYVMGLAFGFGWTPCVGPALASILMIASGMGDIGRGGLLLLVYGVGMTAPFIIAALVVVHIWAFHTTGNNNPTGVEVRRTSKEDAKKDTLPFWPYFVIKDLFALAVILTLFFAVVGFMPNYLGHPDNYIEANALATPAHIVPEWYFLPFYAILRAFTSEVWVVQIASFVTGGIIDAKFFGVLAMFGAIAVMALVPWLDTSSVRSGRYRPMFKWWFALLVIDFFALMWLGAMPAEEPYASFSLIASAYWFAYFLVILPLLGVIEKPLAQPETIEADFDAHYAPKTGGTKTLVKPAE